MNEQEREAFEAWYSGRCLPGGADWFRRDPLALDEYEHGNTQEAWAGWQARAAVSEANLLAAKVPADLPENETPQMHDAAMAVLYAGVTRGNTNALWRAYRAALLAATPAPAPEATRSQRLAEAGYTPRDTRLECDECGAKVSAQMLPVHECAPAQAQQPLHITVLIDWLAVRYRAAGGKEGITDLSAFCEEVMRWTEHKHGIGASGEASK